MVFCEFFLNKLIAKHIYTLAPGAHGGQGAHLRLSDPGLSARTGSLVVVDTWSGVVAPLKAGKTAQGAWCAAVGAFRALPASLLLSYLGATIRAQAVIESLVRQHPRVRIKSAAGGGVSSL